MLAGASRNALKRSARITAQSPAGCLSVQRHASTAAFPERWARKNDRERKRLRSNPWDFELDTTFRGEDGNTNLSRYNLELSKYADQGMAHTVFKVASQMKQEGVEPDLATYNHLLRILADKYLYAEAWAVIEDMRNMQIHPNRTSCHHLLHASRHCDLVEQLRISDFMDELGIEKNETTYSQILARCAATGRLELALQNFNELQERGILPHVSAVKRLVEVAAESGQVRLAVELADHFEETSVRSLDVTSWVACLSASAEALYAAGVQHCWRKVVHNFGVNPDEGLCIAVLHTAARHGLPTLANEVIEVLVALQVPLQEHHFAPVIEACTRHGSLKAALGTLAIMRSIGLTPEIKSTADPIHEYISESADRVDEAYALLEEMRADGQTIDVVAFNTLLRASRKLKDLQRAVGTYKAAADLGVTPDVRSYNILFSACIDARHRDLGDKLLSEMKAAGVVPDESTYCRFILLCLKPNNYEDAFFYLEEMKSAGFKPPPFIYHHIVRKCVDFNDTRYNIAVEEMVECGYGIPRDLQAYIDSGGRVDKRDQPERVIKQDGDRDVASAVEEMKKIFLEADVSSPQGKKVSVEHTI